MVKELNFCERELETPEYLMSKYPVNVLGTSIRDKSIEDTISIFNNTDDRILAIVGPCSMDSNVLDDGTPSVLRFAEKLKDFSEKPVIQDNIKIIMRAPVSKPRTSLGQSGLSQTNPELAYNLARRIVNMGLPLAMEILSRDDADYYENLLTLGWVGARNVEDTGIRHTASDMRIPILFKNSTNGSLVAAENAIETARHSHIVRRMRASGKLVVKESLGNKNTGVILRGGNSTTPESFAQQFLRLREYGSPLIVDCSHGNSSAFGDGRKTAEAQLACSKALRDLVLAGNVAIKGVMLESYLLAGSDPSGKTPGMSVTDPCIDIQRSFEELVRIALVNSKVKKCQGMHD